MALNVTESNDVRLVIYALCQQTSRSRADVIDAAIRLTQAATKRMQCGPNAAEIRARLEEILPADPEQNDR